MKHVAYLRRIAALSAVTAITACSGGGGSHPALPATAPISGTGSGPSTPVNSSSVAITTLKPSAAFTSATTLIGPATAIASVVMHIVPNQQNAAGLVAYAQAASDPKNGSYRHFLSPTDIASRYGATAADYAAVEAYFASFGLKVGGWPQRLSITVAGPRASMEKALGTTFAMYHGNDGHTLLAPKGNVVFSRAIPVAAIANAAVETQSHWRNFVLSRGGPSQGTLSGYAPQQMAAAFDFDSAYNAGFTGKGITIGIIGTGPAMGVDFAAFKTQYNFGGGSTLSFPPVTAAAAANAGGSPTAVPPPVTPNCGGPGTSSNPNYPPSESPTANCNPEDIEAQIDTEQAALAKDASIEFYLAYVPSECATPNNATPCAPDPSTGLGYTYQGLAEADDEIQQIIADNTADIVSGSYGGPEILQSLDYLADANGNYDPIGLGVTEFAALASEGIATFMASGDQGAQTCAPYVGGPLASATCVSYPASDTSLTAVGGATVPLSNAGTYLGPITGWGQQTSIAGTGGASGGGISCYVPAPSWQVEPAYISAEQGSLVVTNNSCSGFATVPGGGRLVPDITLEGDPATGIGVVANVAFGENQIVVGGTSVATPQMAAMWALVLQACAQTSGCATATGSKPYRLGNAAGLLWGTIYKSQTLYTSTIYDVTFGNNGIVPCAFQGRGACPNPMPTAAPGYPAGLGWDAVTGLGIPFARHLITAVTGA